MRTLLALLCGLMIATSALAAEQEAWREARVRPQNPRLADLLRTGAARSATFRELVNRLESGNVIVYLTTGQLRSNLAGKLTWITKAGNFRYLKATLNIEQTADQMIATLAHELQHALEVSDEQEVTDQRSLLALYQRIGRPNRSGPLDAWETQAAQDAGIRVRRELLSAL
jgi:hypothetical protein